MHIQYVGFNVVADGRTYRFHVIDTHPEVREFTVKVQFDAFREARLKIQDGPAICFARLQQELQGETQESPAGTNLNIEEHDIREYWEREHPRPPLEHKTESRHWMELNEQYQQGSPPTQPNTPAIEEHEVP
jgi:hypothetical protein